MSNRMDKNKNEDYISVNGTQYDKMNRVNKYAESSYDWLSVDDLS